MTTSSESILTTFRRNVLHPFLASKPCEQVASGVKSSTLIVEAVLPSETSVTFAESSVVKFLNGRETLSSDLHTRVFDISMKCRLIDLSFC